MNRRKLENEIIEVVAEALQHFDYIDKNGVPNNFAEITASIDGAVYRYRDDVVFRSKVQMLASRIVTVVHGDAGEETDLGKVAYEAFCNAGRKIPADWDSIDKHERIMWDAAAESVLTHELLNRHLFHVR